MPTYKDDRTDDYPGHTVLVGGLDTFMSGWGDAPGKSYAFWACRPEDEENVTTHIRARGDIKRVRRIEHRPHDECPIHLGKGDHCHVCLVHEGHRYREGP